MVRFGWGGTSRGCPGCPASGLAVGEPVKVRSNSRRAHASSVHVAGGSTGAVGVLLANGDTTARTTVDTTPDRSSPGSGVVVTDKGACC